MDILTNIIIEPILQCFSWFGLFVFELDRVGLWLPVFVLFTVYRFVLSPIFSSSININSSDYVKKQKSNNKRGK